jgi:hypothetical protein
MNWMAGVVDNSQMEKVIKLTRYPTPAENSAMLQGILSG